MTVTETITWIVGLALLGLGVGVQFGWAATLIAWGAVFTIWPLVKQFGE